MHWWDYFIGEEVALREMHFAESAGDGDGLIWSALRRVLP